MWMCECACVNVHVWMCICGCASSHFAKMDLFTSPSIVVGGQSTTAASIDAHHQMADFWTCAGLSL